MFPIVTDWDRVYDVNTFIEQLPAYNQSEGTDTLMDLNRILNESGNYIWIGMAAPRLVYLAPGTPTNIIAYGTLNGSESLPPGTYVTAINFYCSQPEGFKYKIYDKGTKASIFYGEYSKNEITASDMSIFGDAESDSGGPFGPAWVTSPFIITPPGVLNWEIVNLSPNDALIQMMLVCATPVNNVSLNTRNIMKG